MEAIRSIEKSQKFFKQILENAVTSGDFKDFEDLRMMKEFVIYWNNFQLFTNKNFIYYNNEFESVIDRDFDIIDDKFRDEDERFIYIVKEEPNIKRIYSFDELTNLKFNFDLHGLLNFLTFNKINIF